MSDELILWDHNPARTFIDDLSADELELLNADIQDAIDGVLEDWRDK
jgi:hypothetical protein